MTIRSRTVPADFFAMIPLVYWKLRFARRTRSSSSSVHSGTAWFFSRKRPPKCSPRTLVRFEVDDRRPGVPSQRRAIVEDLEACAGATAGDLSWLQPLDVVDLGEDPLHRLGIVAAPVPRRIADDVDLPPLERGGRRLRDGQRVGERLVAGSLLDPEQRQVVILVDADDAAHGEARVTTPTPARQAG